MKSNGFCLWPWSKKNRKYYDLQNLQSPTSQQLAKHLKARGWLQAKAKKQADFSDQNLNFDAKAGEILEFKHQLATLCQQYCPDIIPESWYINDQQWPLVIELLQKQDANQGQKFRFILKPALLNNGQHIKIFHTIAEIEAHFSQMNRMGGDQVLQRYIEPPHLLKGPHAGHKYSLRLFLILSNFNGIGLYPKGYYNILLKPYHPDISDLSAHLSNEHLSHETMNVVQIPSTQYARLFEACYPEIKNISRRLVSALQKAEPQAFSPEAPKAMAIFGLDFMLDANQKVWLLEANHGPCFPTDKTHPLQNPLYHEFWEAVIEDFVVPLQEEGHHQNLRHFQTLHSA